MKSIIDRGLLLRSIMAAAALLFTSSVSRTQAGAPPQDRPPFSAGDPLDRHRPPPDDPMEKDLAKRRLFIHKVNKARIATGFVDPAALSDKPLPAAERLTLLRDSDSVLDRAFRATNPEEVRWSGLWVSEMAPKSDTGFESKPVRIQAEWEVGNYIVRAWRHPGYDRLGLLIRIPQRTELEFRSRPHAMQFEDSGFKEWEFIPTQEIGKLLAELLQIEPQELAVRGELHEIDGINVFKGAFNPTDSLRVASVGPEGETITLEVTGIMITDTDPQYVGLGFDISKEAGE